MIDVSKKANTLRTATAMAELKVSPETIRLLHANKIPKGNPLEVAKVAAVQAVKNTSQIIPYCHPMPVDFVGVTFDISETMITVHVEVKAIYKTGVEMEALTGASVAALTMYDMMKMLDETMEITGVKLLKKRGGKSDYRETLQRPLRAAVLVMSDSVAAGEKSDSSGRMIEARLYKEHIDVVDYAVIPDDVAMIRAKVIGYADDMQVDIVLTTGGTGFSPRDYTPEAMDGVIERDIPGIPEALRAYGQERTPYSMLSRGKAGIRGNTIIVNLPGSTRGVAESLDALFPGLIHAFKMIWMQGSWADAPVDRSA